MHHNQLAKKYHPDINKDPAEKEIFVQIQEAYDIDYLILCDEEKQGGPTGTCGFPGGSDASYGEFFGFSKVLFSNIFDGGFDSPKVKTGSGQPYTSGSDIGVETCKACKGSGVQYIVIASGFHIQTTCPSCNTKISSGNRCSTCSVIGQVKEKKPITIDISAGVEDGTKIRLIRQRNTGDLFAKSNIIVNKEISFYRAFIGGYIVVLIDGDVESKVPEAFTI
ncbi:8680_t:CDS:2 [Entrophospora sp. SA101]|nr:8680_t:CDS:2 [Entrophospora sp. SA101]